MSRLGTLTQLDRRTWSTISYQQLPGRAMTVLFAYGVMAWNRFGLLGFVAPRAPVRLVLVGVYSWIALTAAVWLASHRGSAGPAKLRDAAVATAVAHVPIVTLGLFMAIVAGFARILGPGTVLAILVFAFWMPALLVRAFRDVAGLRWLHAAAAALVVHIAWLAGPGRFLHDQVGHLL